MNAKNEDYEIIARRMDGSDVRLTEAQEALADEISADTGIVARALDVQLPGGALHRVNARIKHSRLAGQKQRASRLCRAGTPAYWSWAGAAAGIAAAVIVAVVLLLPSGPNKDDKKIIKPATPANSEQFVYSTLADDDLDYRVEALSEELADTRTALMLDEDFSTELAMASFEQEMEELMLDRNGLDSWPPRQ